MITIHYDFTDGTEISYIEGTIKKDNFTTKCLNFFSFDYDADVMVIKKDGTSILKSDLLNENKHTLKDIREEHNLHKMLVANAFKFLPKPLLIWCKNRDPNSECSYTHTISQSPLGDFRIEWKSWKKDPSYSLFLEDNYLGEFYGDLDDIKKSAVDYLKTKTNELKNFLNI